MKKMNKLFVVLAVVVALSMLAGVSVFADTGNNTVNQIIVWGPGRTQQDIETYNLDPDSLGFHAQVGFFMSEELPENWFEIMKDYIIFDGRAYDRATEEENPVFNNGGFHGMQGETGYLYLIYAGTFEVNDPMTIEILPGFGDPANAGVYEAPEVAQAVFTRVEGEPSPQDPTHGDPATQQPADDTQDDVTTPGDAGVLAYAILAGASLITLRKFRK